MYRPNSLQSEMLQLGRAVLNTVLLGAILLASVGFPVLGLQGIMEHNQGGTEGIVMSIRHAYWAVYSFATGTLANPMFSIGFSALILIQVLRPAVTHPRVFSRGLATDMAWMAFHVLIWGTFIGVFLGITEQLLEPLIGIAHVGLLSGMPYWLAIVIGYLISDFLSWFNHLLRHKVPLFWFFHELHHSQTQINPFTPYRSHPVDELVSKTIALLPTIFFEHTLGIAFIYLAIFQLHDAFVHSNIRTDLGWFGRLFVTPLAHRMHHSVDPKHYDTNMGGIFCIWDRIFGTYSPGDHVCEKIGTSDARFPLESDTSIARWPFMIPMQLLYPYMKAIRYVVGLYSSTCVTSAPADKTVGAG